jgi:hypothetical protein
MPEERGRNTSIGDGTRADSAGTKPIYEKPCIVQLGELAGGQGVSCFDGFEATPLCINGSHNYDCYTGMAAADSCGAGIVGIPPE